MASYHFAVQVLGRSKGHSAVAAAAYRARGELRDERSGRTENYSRKDGHQRSEILLPDGAAPWLADRERLWNHVEAMEKRADAQLAREINMALPHEMTDAQRYELVRNFVREQFVSRGMVADIAWHRPVPDNGDDPRNYHAHVMLTLRQATPQGLRRVKTREWNSDGLLDEWRKEWERHQNRALERAGSRSRVDSRTLAAQRDDAHRRGDLAQAAVLDREPEIHIGPRAANAARRGYEPSSRERRVSLPKRPRRQGRGSGGRQRVVRYPVIDDGSRQSWNAAIVDRNQKRLLREADRWEIKLARARKLEMRALAGAESADQRLNVLARTPRLVGGPEWQQLQAQKVRSARHARLCRELLKGLERILARTLFVRQELVGRQRVLLRGRDLVRGRGRTRPRPW